MQLDRSFQLAVSMRIPSREGAFALFPTHSKITPETTAFLGMSVPWNKVAAASFPLTVQPTFVRTSMYFLVLAQPELNPGGDVRLGWYNRCLKKCRGFRLKSIRVKKTARTLLDASSRRTKSLQNPVVPLARECAGLRSTSG